MKTLLSICTAVLLAASAWSQTYNSGDKDLDASLKTINIEASKDLSGFKLEIAKTYSTTQPKVNSMFSLGMSAGDIFIAFEIATITRKPIDNVITAYSKNKGKGWGVIAKELGIKPGSAEFHKLKGNTKNKAAKKSAKSGGGTTTKSNASKGNGAKGNASKGKSNGNGNGNGKKK